MMMVGMAFLPAISAPYIFASMVVFSMACTLKASDLNIEFGKNKRARERGYSSSLEERLRQKQNTRNLTPIQELRRDQLLQRQANGTITAKESKELNRLNEKYNKNPLSKREQRQLERIDRKKGPGYLHVRDERALAIAHSDQQNQEFESSKQSLLDSIQQQIDMKSQQSINGRNAGTLTVDQIAQLDTEISQLQAHKDLLQNDLLNTAKSQNDTIVNALNHAYSHQAQFSEYDSNDIITKPFNTVYREYCEGIVNNQRDTFEQEKNSYLMGAQKKIDDRQYILNAANNGTIAISPAERAALTKEINDIRGYISQVQSSVLNPDQTRNDTILGDVIAAERNGNTDYSSYGDHRFGTTTFREALTTQKDAGALNVPTLSGTCDVIKQREASNLRSPLDNTF